LLKPVFLGDGAIVFAAALVGAIDLNITAPVAFPWCLRVWKQLLQFQLQFRSS
jgi:hypothetical protein